MPLIRINAHKTQPVLHQNACAPDLTTEIARRDPDGTGPVIIMIHGYKYHPGHRHACPHKSIYATDAQVPRSWPRNLGFGLMNTDEGLGIAFGWAARGALWSVHRRSAAAGLALVDLIQRVRTLWPDRPIHLLTHSMGSEVAFEALHHLPEGAVGRVILMAGASFHARAEAALTTPAGSASEVINITSRENDLFDFLFERLLGDLRLSDRSVGAGLNAGRSVTLQLDCDQTLAHLERLGRPVAPPRRRICHWSPYARIGALRLYSALLRDPVRFPLERLRDGLPEQTAPRWSRLLSWPDWRLTGLGWSELNAPNARPQALPHPHPRLHPAYTPAEPQSATT